ncbi:hypothetical protein [Lysobacter sp. P5_B9]
MSKVKYSTVVVVVMLFVVLSDVILRLNSFVGVSNGSTLAVLLLNILAAGVMVAFLLRRAWRDNCPTFARRTWFVLLAWNVITFLRGGYLAHDYWAWKSLVTTHLFMFLVPFALLIGLDIKLFERIPRAVVWLVMPLALLLLPLSLSYDTELFARVAMPTYLMLLLMPFVGRRYGLAIAVVACISVMVDPSYRVNLIRIALAIAVVIAYVSRIGLRTKLVNGAAIVLFVAPLFFLFLGLSGKFNVFSDSVSVGGEVAVVEGGQVRESALSADTRTFLYREVLTSMERRGSSFLIGQGAGTGYESKFFRASIVAAGGRSGSEVGFLNTLLYSGIVGVSLYAALIFVAAFYAFNHSRSSLCKMIGLFLVFKWVLFFVEEIPKMDLNFFMTWIMIGLCFSREFRMLDDRQVREFLSGKVAKARAPLSRVVHTGSNSRGAEGN